MTVRQIPAADVNRDGKVDLICADQDDDTLSVLTNNGSGGFALFSTQPYGLLAIILILGILFYNARARYCGFDISR